jgi:hypothetical protein
MGQGVLDGLPLAPLGPAQRRLLAGTELRQEGLVGMDVDAPAMGAGRTALPQRAGGADGSGEADCGPRVKGISIWCGQRSACRSQSRVKAVLGKRQPRLRTGQALQ